MIPVLTAREMRQADGAAIRAGVPAGRLMEAAAAGLVRCLRERYPDWRRVVVACGPGNNGGDGLAAARLLAREGLSPSLFTLRDPGSYAGPAATNARRAREAGLEVASLSGSAGSSAFRAALLECDGVVDALFGTGLSRPLTGAAARVVARINGSGRPVVSADVPSGLSSDTGDLLGECVRARLTVAFGAAKHCHVFFPARAACGALRVVAIGIPRRTLTGDRRLSLVEEGDLRALLPPRSREAHKGDFGRVAIVAGSRGKAGAAILAARGALRAGAGLVTVLCPASLEDAIVAALPETMTRGLPERDGALAPEAAAAVLESMRDFDAVAIGPGLGTSRGAVAVVRAALAARRPLVCDADALNALAGRPALLARRRAATILTPHPGEAARLSGAATAEVQKDRVGAARRLARRARAVVVLKGASTLTATPDGRVAVNPTGSPVMAAGGSGDVLTGAVAALLAAGLSAERAAWAAAYLHGAAGERLEAGLGDAGLLARELADALPLARAALRRGTAPP